MVRRAASRGGTLRCAEAIALPTVMSISPTRLIDDPNMVQSRGDFKTALLPYSVHVTCCLHQRSWSDGEWRLVPHSGEHQCPVLPNAVDPVGSRLSTSPTETACMGPTLANPMGADRCCPLFAGGSLWHQSPAVYSCRWRLSLRRAPRLPITVGADTTPPNLSPSPARSGNRLTRIRTARSRWRS